jgi:hypothetical protein
MYSRKFNKSIGIVGKKSKQKLEGSVDMPDPEAKVFVDHIFDLLTTLAKKPLGRMLLEEIEATKRAVIIFCDDASGAGSAAQPYPGTVENEMGRFVKIRQIPNIAVTALQKNDPSYLPPTMANYGALVHSALERSKMNRDMVAALCGISRDDLDLIELGMKQLPPEAYHRFALVLYDHLDVGSGCSVGLRVDLAQAQGDDTELIILAHELVCK